MFVIWGIPQAVLTACAFAMVTPVLQAVCPYRLRGLGVAMGVMYVVLIGGFAGGILADFFTNAIGVRGAVLVLGIPSSIIGSLLLMNGARFIRHDLSLVVEELLEEQEEHRRRTELGVATPVLQIVNTDFSYGPVQVLFDVNFEMQRGECVALLGTNGAGKSTILRIISGLERARARSRAPERSQRHLRGAPNSAPSWASCNFPGGKGVFPSLTVDQNLSISARLRGGTREEIDARIDGVLELFPELVEKRGMPARSLSGGQQQMLALARVLHARARDPADRRVVARTRAGGRRTLARDHRPAAGERPDDADRRAVVEHRARQSRIVRSSWRRAKCASRGRPPSCSSATTWRARCSSAPRAADARCSHRVFTANLLFAGAVDGLIIAVMAMGIVLVYRSSRVINFAAGELGVPAAALLAIMVTKDKIPYWLALVAALAVGTAAGAVVELVVIRRLAKAPRVIVLVATIGVAEFAQAVTTTLPGYRRGDVTRPEFPTPIASHWNVGSVRVDGSQLLTILVVPLIVVGAVGVARAHTFR